MTDMLPRTEYSLGEKTMHSERREYTINVTIGESMQENLSP